MRYFTLDEFDSPDLPGSGAFMHQEFLELLDDARDLEALRFRILERRARAPRSRRVLLALDAAER